MPQNQRHRDEVRVDQSWNTASGRTIHTEAVGSPEAAAKFLNNLQRPQYAAATARAPDRPKQQERYSGQAKVKEWLGRVPDKAKPTGHQGKPAHQQAKPMHHQTKSTHHQAKPTHHQGKPTHHQAKPTHLQAKPTHHQGKPTHWQTKSAYYVRLPPKPAPKQALKSILKKPASNPAPRPHPTRT